MNEKIKVTVYDKCYEIDEGITYFDFIKLYFPDMINKVILVKVDNLYKELSNKVFKSANISFVLVDDSFGNRSYLNGLVFVCLCAFKSIWPNSSIVVKNSIDKGLYIESSNLLTEKDITRVKDEMRSIISQDLSFDKVDVERTSAIDYFDAINDKAKSSLLRYNTNTYITLYKLRNCYNYFFDYMPYSTGCLNLFDIVYLNDHGFVLLYPNMFLGCNVSKYNHHKMMFDAFFEGSKWANMMGVSNVSGLNKLISAGGGDSLIRMEEAIQSYKLLNIAKDIYEKRCEVKVVLIAGPSSSGKTTTSKKLCAYLKSFGLVPQEISMDDYFLNRKDTPKDLDGNYKYESLDALRLDLFEDNINRIINGEEVITPLYDFVKGESNLIKKVKIPSNGIVIVEGIHALNPLVLSHIDKSRKFKIYISPLSVMHLDDHNRLSTADNRLLRRIIRDNRTRGYDVSMTISNWMMVRRGEEENIFAFQDEADVIYNTSFIYELSVLKIYVEPLLYSIDVDSPYYSEAKRLINVLKVFLPISSDSVPCDSLLREFIGGSCF